MLYLLFLGMRRYDVSRVHYKKKKKLITQKKRASTQKYNNPFILKRFRILLISGSCGLLLEAKHLDDL